MRKRKQIMMITGFCLCLVKGIGQSPDGERVHLKYALFNVGSSAICAGLGSLLNRRAETTPSHAFLEGFYKGAIGGSINHVGLSLSHQIERQKNISMAWPARLVNSLGSSIVQNAADNLGTFERLHFNLFASRIEYYPYRKSFRVRLHTSALYGLTLVGSQGRFNLGKSLESGVFYFTSHSNFNSVLTGSTRAIAMVGSVGMKTDLIGDSFYKTFAEEIAHIMQYDRKVWGNPFFTEVDEQWKLNHLWYKQVSRYIYLDMNGPIFLMSYALGGSYDCNFFEREAIHYANRRFRPSCN